MLWVKLKPSSSSSSTYCERFRTSTGDETAEEQLPMPPQRLSKMKSSMNVVNEEYINALRAKSYVDMYSRLHQQLERSSTVTPPTPPENGEETRKEKSQHTTTHCPPPSNCHSEDQIPNFLLAATSSNSSSGRFIRHLSRLLLDFFDITSQASAACASLLSTIDRARSHHRSIHRLLPILSFTPSASSPSALSDLCSLLELDNPLSAQNLIHLRLIHSRYPTLTRRLASAHKKISRHLKLVKFARKASGAAVAALIGAVVVLAAVASSACLGRPSRWFAGWMRLERAKATVDAATKGAYIIERDLDTMSQMLRRAHDEVEHGRDVARLVVRNREWEMVREVVKEMEGRRGEVGFGLEEQLQELEEHVYLCLITINRSRRLVSEEMMELREAPVRPA